MGGAKVPILSGKQMRDWKDDEEEEDTEREITSSLVFEIRERGGYAWVNMWVERRLRAVGVAGAGVAGGGKERRRRRVARGRGERGKEGRKGKKKGGEMELNE